MDNKSSILSLFLNCTNTPEEIYIKSSFLDKSFKNINEFYHYCCKEFLNSNCEEILDEIDYYSNKKIINSKTIPQFSDFLNGSEELINILSKVDFLEFNYLKLGKLFLSNGKKDGAYRKYGENHVKLAFLLGYVNFNEGFKFSINSYGIFVNQLDEKEKKQIIRKNILRIPIISHLLNESKNKKISVIDELRKVSDLSESTIKRRTSSIKNLLNQISMLNDKSISGRLERIDDI